ncbi:unnamed protein product [Clonostachys solani]|uniref:Six-hairpin glycosidase n=1 Tax=Clonostachys solani TaxID=160281 RepID=A0A9N9ZHP0_9HYPO|nr:unnamed protein product [Clonostachys solani]
MAAQIKSEHFSVDIDNTTGAVVSISNPRAEGDMNWVSSPDNAPWQPLGSRWGMGYVDLGADSLHRTYWKNPSIVSSNETSAVLEFNLGPLLIKVSRSLKDDGKTFHESYSFHNVGTEDLDLDGPQGTSIAIFTPFNDHYTNTEDALQRRAHAHVWANGGSNAWVKMTQMGGHGPNLGLVVTEGSLRGYSIESRDRITMSNTRGVFLLHPITGKLAPNEQKAIEWSMFWHNDWDDFFEKCAELSFQFIHFHIPCYTLVGDEVAALQMTGAVNEKTTVNGQSVVCDGKGRYSAKSDTFKGSIDVKTPGTEYSAKVYLNRVDSVEKLVASRVRFIIDKQQIYDLGKPGDGAYAVFDNEAQLISSWDTDNDRNLGRERVGMGIFMARWLREHPDDDKVRNSLKRYYKFVCEELQDQTGYVLNGPGSREKRLYNWPWVMQLHIAVASTDLDTTGVNGGESPLERFEKTMESFYDEGGRDLYPIGLPLLECLRYLQNFGTTKLLERAKKLFLNHGQRILDRGVDYPPFEVNFEQSIVAPAAIMLLELYRFTKEPKWLGGAELQMKTLLRFQGKQPDYRLHDIAIRHWDGYWFGKDRMWGDTFPHYWSTLNAVALHHYSYAKADEASKKRADGIILGNLALFSPDGSASCAWIYPLSVNGRAGHYKDPYANDQDWALNHLLYLKQDDEYGQKGHERTYMDRI